MGLIASVASHSLRLFTLYMHVSTWGYNAFSHIKDHFQPMATSSHTHAFRVP